jgi:hypothetical protein
VEVTANAINKSLDGENAEETHMLIQKQEAMLSKVLNRSAYLYHDGLKKAKNQKQGNLEHDEIEEQVKGKPVSIKQLYFYEGSMGGVAV